MESVISFYSLKNQQNSSDCKNKQYHYLHIQAVLHNQASNQSEHCDQRLEMDIQDHPSTTTIVHLPQ